MDIGGRRFFAALGKLWLLLGVLTCASWLLSEAFSLWRSWGRERWFCTAMAQLGNGTAPPSHVAVLARWDESVTWAVHS